MDLRQQQRQFTILQRKQEERWARERLERQLRDERAKKDLRNQKRLIAKARPNIVLDIKGRLTNFDEQIYLPVVDALQSAQEKEMLYFQVTTGGDIPVHQLIRIEGKNGESRYWNSIYHHLVPYRGGNPESIIQLNSAFHIVLLRSTKVPSKKMQQAFREGEVHCVIQPLVDLWMGMSKNSESEASMKRCRQIANKIKKLEEVYPDGVPEDKMDEVAKIAQRKLIIHNVLGNESAVYNQKSTKMFHFTNTRANHLEKNYLTLDKQFQSVTPEQMEDILYQHNKDKKFYIYNGDIKNGIPQSIRSIDGSWAVFHPDYQLFQDFSKAHDIPSYGLNNIAYPEVGAFIKESRIINSAPTPLCDEPNDLDGVVLVDIEKAYTQHASAPIYKGFLGHIQHWRNLRGMDAGFITTHLGIFQFLVQSTIPLLDKLGITVGLTYTLPSPEIEYMMSLGLQITLLAGCWGSRFDIQYTPAMLEKVTGSETERRYCTWAGKLGSDNSITNFTFKGSKEWAGHLKEEMGEDNILYFEDMELIVAKIPKKTNYVKHHILAFITSYTRQHMIKLMMSVTGELVKVVMDGLYFRGDLPEPTVPHHNNQKLKEHPGFRSAWYYPSEVDTSDWALYVPTFDGNCVLTGAGGTGKSYSVMNDRGLINVLRVVPTHELGGMGGRYTTIHKLIGEQCTPYKQEWGEPGITFIDELTMIKKEWIEKAIEMYPNTLFIIAGDIEGEQWFQCRSGYPGHFQDIWLGIGWRHVSYEQDYRATGQLITFKKQMREEMKRIFHDGNKADTIRMNIWVKKNYPITDFMDAVKMFAVGDTWIAGTHATNEKLLLLGIKSGVDKDGKERGSFTTHAFQGKTIRTGKVFVSLDAFEYAMLYTAVSRCIHIDQLVIVA